MANGVLHLAGLRVIGLERLDLLLELGREEPDLLDQYLYPIRNDGVGNQPPHLLPAAREVEPVVPVAGARGAANLAQPAQVGRIREGPRIGQQHVHRLAEPAEREVECRPDVLGLQHAHAGIQVARVRDRLEALHHGGVPALEPRQLVHVRRERPLDVRRREDGERVLQIRGHAPVIHH